MPKLKRILILAALVFSANAFAASKNILLTGYWPPTNEMLRRLSPTHPQWIGKNWRGTGYDVYAYFPEFPNGGIVGQGDFRVDFASAFNDFMKYTDALQPIAIVNFGQGMGPWELEKNVPPVFQKMFESGNIPSTVGEKVKYPIPPALAQPITYYSSLPLEAIKARVNEVTRVRAWIDDQGLGEFICAFTAYLSGWYHEQHKDPDDPAYNAMSGFIHVQASVEDAEAAVNATLESVIENLSNEVM